MNKVYSKNSIGLSILYVFLLFSFFEIPYLTYTYPVFSKIYIGLQAFSMIILFLMMIKNKTYSKIINYIIMFELFLILITYINNGNISNVIHLSIINISLSLLFDYGIKKNKDVFIKTAYRYVLFLVLINLISIILHPTGMYYNSSMYFENWILGYKNSHITYMILLIILKYLYSNNKSNYLSNIIIFMITIVSTYLVNNTTGLIGILILGLYVFLPKLFNNTKLFNIRNYTLISVLSFFGIVFLKIQNYFTSLISVFNKDITFTGRIYIWDKVINLIKEKPFVGYGNDLFRYSKNIFSTHNLLLDLLYKGGIILLLLYVMIVYKSIKELMKYKNNKITSIVSLAIFIIFIMGITEAYSFNSYMYLFILGYNIGNLIKE